MEEMQSQNFSFLWFDFFSIRKRWGYLWDERYYSENFLQMLSWEYDIFKIDLLFFPLQCKNHSILLNDKCSEFLSVLQEGDNTMYCSNIQERWILMGKKEEGRTNGVRQARKSIILLYFGWNTEDLVIAMIWDNASFSWNAQLVSNDSMISQSASQCSLSNPKCREYY